MTLEERGSGSTEQDQTTHGGIKKPTRRCFIPLWFYPLATSISIPFACIVSYLIYLNSVEDKSSSWTDDFPFISDTGIYPPASCWFTLLFFFVGFFSFSSALVRYMQLKTECRGRRCVTILNIITFIAGCTSSVGVIIVAAFQYDRSLVIHLVGAGLAFGVACIFFILQTVMKISMSKEKRQRFVNGF
ncbi:hypothetical protein FSP39_023720 [Pinctada imbricata]|uniref:CWH43-like N-terminal domain-containing protein n=1 Tax=Pinctada imbricata TaxID=66713 RepID=A0AA88YFT2_PINIB|nr:hypothetical protein FSP39_023720 [Pinctada imbricata]